jgi:hypothetical protein
MAEKYEQACEAGKRIPADTPYKMLRPQRAYPPVPDTGPDGAEKLMSKTLKAAHPTECTC